jgi:multisubunit Na+/H+ antiporter MnhE subunit
MAPALLAGVRWAIRWVVAMAIWLLLTDTVVLQELFAGAIVAGLVATAGIWIPRPWDHHLRPPPPGAVLGPLLRLVPDTWSLAVLVAKRIAEGDPIAGRLRAEPAEQTGTIEEWWGSLAPSRYVIGADEETGTELVHELGKGTKAS